MSTWNFAVLVDTIARETPDRAAVVHGARRITWRELASRARALAWHLHTAAGLGPSGTAVLALPNCPEYLESFVAVRKLGGVPLNVGAGTSGDALHRSIDASDAKVVVCSPSTAQGARDASRRIPKRWRPMIMDLGSQYEAAIAAADPPEEWDLELPTADDLIFLANRDLRDERTRPATVLPAAPLVRGNGLATVLGALSAGGRVVFVDPGTFDAQLVWRTVAIEHVDLLTIGGDAYAGRLLAALPDAQTRHDLASLRTISSSGAALSPEVAQALEAALPEVTIVDAHDGVDPRTSNKAKVRPSEVEVRLRKHRSIADCVVVGVADPRIGRLVVAIIQVADGHYLDAPELSAWCRAHLPSTLTPGTFVFVDTIDRLPSGAPDHEALRRVAVARLLETR